MLEELGNLVSALICTASMDQLETDLGLQLRGRAQSNQVAFVHDRQTVAALGFFHEVRCH